jgi:hypothetical protein
LRRSFHCSRRSRAIGTHFPEVADLTAADSWAARLAVRFKPGIPDDFTLLGDREPVALGVMVLVRETIVR